MNAERLIDKYLEITKSSNISKSLAQKQGARKGGRTRSRRLYTGESSGGYLTYHYYHRDKGPDYEPSLI